MRFEPAAANFGWERWVSTDLGARVSQRIWNAVTRCFPFEVPRSRGQIPKTAPERNLERNTPRVGNPLATTEEKWNVRTIHRPRPQGDAASQPRSSALQS